MTHTLAFRNSSKTHFFSPTLKAITHPIRRHAFSLLLSKGENQVSDICTYVSAAEMSFTPSTIKDCHTVWPFYFFIWSFNAFCKWAHKSLLRQYCIFEIAEKWFPCAHMSWLRLESYALVGSGGGHREVNVTNYLCDVLTQNPPGFSSRVQRQRLSTYFRIDIVWFSAFVWVLRGSVPPRICF